MEQDIEKLEAEKANHESQLADSNIFKDHGKLSEVSTAHQKIVKQLEDKNSDWENTVEKLDELES